MRQVPESPAPALNPAQLPTERGVCLLYNDSEKSAGQTAAFVAMEARRRKVCASRTEFSQWL
jgi:hypothetical protein